MRRSSTRLSKRTSAIPDDVQNRNIPELQDDHFGVQSTLNTNKHKPVLLKFKLPVPATNESPSPSESKENVSNKSVNHVAKDKASSSFKEAKHENRTSHKKVKRGREIKPVPVDDKDTGVVGEVVTEAVKNDKSLKRRNVGKEAAQDTATKIKDEKAPVAHRNSTSKPKPKKRKRHLPTKNHKLCHECGKAERRNNPMLTCTRTGCGLSFHADCLLLPHPPAVKHHDHLDRPSGAQKTLQNGTFRTPAGNIKIHQQQQKRRKWSCPCHIDTICDLAFPVDFDVNRLPAQPITLLHGMRTDHVLSDGTKYNTRDVANVPAFIRQVYAERLSMYSNVQV